MKKRILVLVLSVLFVSNVFAAEKPNFDLKNDVYSLMGYVKDLFYSTKTSDSRESAFLNLNRTRLQLNVKSDKSWETTAILDNEIVSTDFANTSDFSIIRQKNQKNLAFWDLDYVSADEKHYYHRLSMYRLFVKYSTDNFKMIMGKQSIDWSRMRFYGPLDLFNPQSPLDLERDERFGVDALNTEYFFTPTSSLNLVVAPYKNSSRTNFGARYLQKVKDYDLFLIAAENNRDEVFGAAFDGYLFKAGLRGEVTYTRADSKDEYIRTSVGLDYSITPKWYVLGEYFYNGASKPLNRMQFMSSYVYSRQAMSLNKHLIGLMTTYEITPLLKFEHYLVYDYEGNSFFINPELKYNLKSNLDVSVGSQVYSGDKNDSEFGSYRNLYYFQIKWYF